MSLKLFIKNLNVSNLERNFSKEIDLPNTNASIQQVIELICQNLSIDLSKIELNLRGETLNKNKNLNDYLNNSNMASLYLIEKKDSTLQKSVPSKNEIESLVKHIISLFRRKIRRNLLEKLLQDKGRLNEVLKKIPEIKNDPFSFKFIQSYELLKLLMDPKKAEGVLQAHPNIFYVAKILVDYIREESKKTTIDEQFASKASYSIDDMSEDEDQVQAPNYSMGSNAPRTSTQAPAITQDYLSAVLNLLNQQQRPQAQASQTQSQQTAQQPIQSQQQQQGLDRNYFQNIMQQIMTGSGPAQQPTNAQSQPTTNTSSQAMSDEDIASKLEQMHEMGFFDDEINLRALQISGGNVEAALSLIIEGGL